MARGNLTLWSMPSLLYSHQPPAAARAEPAKMPALVRVVFVTSDKVSFIIIS